MKELRVKVKYSDKLSPQQVVGALRAGIDSLARDLSHTHMVDEVKKIQIYSLRIRRRKLGKKITQSNSSNAQ